MIEITSEMIKNSIISQLVKLFPEVSIYKEAISQPSYPHFFVNQINLIDNEERKNYHILSYSMEVRYRNTSDSSTDLKLQQNLDKVSLKLLTYFNIIPFSDGHIRCEDKHIEKVDGVLHFFFTINIMAKYIPDEIQIKQNKITMEVKINGN